MNQYDNCIKCKKKYIYDILFHNVKNLQKGVCEDCLYRENLHIKFPYDFIMFDDVQVKSCEIIIGKDKIDKLDLYNEQMFYLDDDTYHCKKCGYCFMVQKMSFGLPWINLRDLIIKKIIDHIIRC